MKRVWGIVPLIAAAALLVEGATLRRHPYLQNIGPRQATILWTALEAGEGRVEYSLDPDFAQLLSSHAVRREFAPAETGSASYWHQYRADLAELRPNSEYFYRILVDGEVLKPDGVEVLSFRTAQPGPFTFLAFGDNGACTAAQYRLAEKVVTERPSFVVHTGDIAYPDGSFEQFDRCHFAVYQSLMRAAPFFPTPGNHEYWTAEARPYLAVHAPPANGRGDEHEGRFYSFDWGNAHIVSLDSNYFENGRDLREMLRWLDQDLASTLQFWRIVVLHHPPYSAGKHEDEAYLPKLRAQLIPIFERHNVHLVLSGHAHSYQRTHPMRGGLPTEAGASRPVFVVTGGGGASLYPVPSRPFLAKGASEHHYLKLEVSGRHLQARAISITGEELDRFTLTPPPALWDGLILNSADFSPLLIPGAPVEIYGSSFAAEPIDVTQPPYPTELGGVQVEVSGIPLPLSHVSPTRIAAELPRDILGERVLRVKTPNGSVETVIVVSEPSRLPRRPKEPVD